MCSGYGFAVDFCPFIRYDVYVTQINHVLDGDTMAKKRCKKAEEKAVRMFDTVEGYYFRTDLDKGNYDFNQIYTETSFDSVSIKIIDTSLPNQVLVSHADYSSGGTLTLHYTSADQITTHQRYQKHVGLELNYILSGNTFCDIEHQNFALAPGDVICLNSEVMNKYALINGYATMSISIKYSFFEKYFSENGQYRLESTLLSELILPSLTVKDYNGKDYFVLHFDQSKKLEDSEPYRIIQLIYDEVKSKRPGYKLIFPGLLVRLFEAFANSDEYQIEQHHISAADKKITVERMVEFLNEHKYRLTSNDLARTFHFNPQYLNRLFHQKIGKSLHEYNQEVCMKEARHLLQSTDMTIQEIAETLGYASRSQFYSVFYDFHHCSPGQWKTQNRLS